MATSAPAHREQVAVIADTPGGHAAREPLVQLHRYLVERGVEAAWLVDIEGRITYANEEAARIVGRTPAQLAGLSIAAMLDEEGRRQFTRYLDLMAVGHPGEESLQTLLHRPDGTPVWTLVSWRPLHDDDGNLLGWGHTFTEVTDHRRLIEKLQLREQELATAEAVGHVGTWELRTDTGEVWWSSELHRILGRSPTLGGGHVDLFLSSVHPDDRPGLQLLMTRPWVGYSGEPWAGRIVRPDGSVRHVRLRWLTHQAPGDLGTRVTGTVEDVTELTETHQRAERAHEDLLVLSTVAEVGRELATPLEHVLDLADRLLATPLDDEQRRLLTGLRDSGGSLRSLVGDLLAQAQPGQDRAQD